MQDSPAIAPMPAYQPHPLMEHGRLPAWVLGGSTESAQPEVWRGMLVLASDSALVGRVAAVLLDAEAQLVCELLVLPAAHALAYRCVPITLIERIDLCTVFLHATGAQIAQLPIWIGET